MWKKSLPSIFSFINLSFGMLSILFAMNGELKISAVMIFCAAFVDRYDGRIARMFSVSSLFGKELDSLCDLISFGAAPAILSWVLFLKDFGIIGYIVCIIFPIAGAFRLARFNVTEFNNVFCGIPITVAGAFLALVILISIYTIVYKIPLLILMLLLSYLMGSKISFKKF